MEPITILIYITSCHYFYTVMSNFHDYLTYQSNFRSVLQELSYLQSEIERLRNQNEALLIITKKIKN